MFSQDQVNSLQAQINALKAENDKLKAAKPTNGFKITEKGGLSVYGLGRFPVTLYKSQWEKLIGMIGQVDAFIKANPEKLTDKAKTEEVAVA